MTADATPWASWVTERLATQQSEIMKVVSGATSALDELRGRITETERVKASAPKTKWELSRPKDIEPDVFGGKKEAWSKFKEDSMDYADAVRPGVKLQLGWTLRQKEEITQEVIGRNPLSSPAEDWPLRFELFKLLERKTESTSEARKIVECVGDSNGYEVWRLLGVRYEPQVGMKRLKELGELTMLQNKRCKNTSETAMIILEVDRRKRIIVMIGGKPPDEDEGISILWQIMGHRKSYV